MIEYYKEPKFKAFDKVMYVGNDFKVKDQLNNSFITILDMKFNSDKKDWLYRCSSCSPDIYIFESELVKYIPDSLVKCNNPHYSCNERNCEDFAPHTLRKSDFQLEHFWCSSSLCNTRNNPCPYAMAPSRGGNVAYCEVIK